MPDEHAPQGVSKDPYRETSCNSPAESTEEHTIISSPAKSSAQNETQKPIHNEQNIRPGEKWLILIGFLTFAMSIALAIIYYLQLTEMKGATIAATKALELSRKEFESSEAAVSQSNILFVI